MPSFTSQQPLLLQNGPIVEVWVMPTRAALDQLVAAGKPAPPPVKVQALIDTGASGTCINPAIVQALGLSPVSVAQVSTPTTTTAVPCNVFAVNLLFDLGQIAVNDIMAMEAPLGGQNIQMLIGRDVLRHGVLVYIGYINQFTLSF